MPITGTKRQTRRNRWRRKQTKAKPSLLARLLQYTPSTKALEWMEDSVKLARWDDINQRSAFVSIAHRKSTPRIDTGLMSVAPYTISRVLAPSRSSQLPEETVARIQEAMSDAAQRVINSQVESILYTGQDWRFVKPQSPPTQCHTCVFHHGQTYGGNHLTCPLHPSGQEGECGDWEPRQS